MPEYIKYYGLSATPFEDSPDPRFFFSSETHAEALASLTYGTNQRKGFILILGDEGVGKTASVQNLISMLDEKVKAVYIDQGHTSFEHMLKDLLGKLGLTSKRQTKGMMFHELYDFLIQCLERNENVVVFIDDAHKVSLETVEELRLMSNLETSKSKLLQIVLVGRPELNEKLSSELIRQIKQRIVIRNSIRPLTSAESLQYIDHRLRIAGKTGQAVFHQDALSLICKYSEGIPRIINRLCHNAMAAGYRRGEKMISGKTVKKIRHISNFLTDEQARQFKPVTTFVFPVKYIFVIFSVVIIGGALFFFRDHITGIFGGLHKTNAASESSAIIKSDKSNTTRVNTAIADSNPKNVSDKNESKTQVAASRTLTACDVMPEYPVKKVITVKRGLSLSLLALQYYSEANIMLIDYILELNP
jgi:general secretion pathway protein A